MPPALNEPLQTELALHVGVQEGGDGGPGVVGAGGDPCQLSFRTWAELFSPGLGVGLLAAGVVD